MHFLRLKRSWRLLLITQSKLDTLKFQKKKSTKQTRTCSVLSCAVNQVDELGGWIRWWWQRGLSMQVHRRSVLKPTFGPSAALHSQYIVTFIRSIQTLCQRTQTHTPAHIAATAVTALGMQQVFSTSLHLRNIRTAKWDAAISPYLSLA